MKVIVTQQTGPVFTFSFRCSRVASNMGALDFNVIPVKGSPGAHGVGVPAGGTTGQVLAKASGTDYDTEWVTGGGVSGVTDVKVNNASVVTGGVANIPTSSSDGALGLVKPSQTYGIGVMSDGTIGIVAAGTSDIKAGTSNNLPITPGRQRDAVFYGLAKAAGDSTQEESANTVGTYTESAKSAISDMLNGSVSVSGSTPSITAKSGIRYVCGECSTLAITVPATGIIDVLFTSGATATVLTVTPPTGMTMKWANGFDPTALEANTTYEINIMDGCLGVACAWT